MRRRLAQTILLAAGKLAKRLDPENVTITVKKPTLPLFESGNPQLAEEASEMFGTGTQEARRLLGWAEFNLGKGNSEAAMTLIQKARRALGDEPIGGAASRAKRFAETGDTEVLLEGLDRPNLGPCAECNEQGVDLDYTGADGRSVCDDCRDREES